MWPIEARCASIANNYYAVAINRIGTVSIVCLRPFSVVFIIMILHIMWPSQENGY